MEPQRKETATSRSNQQVGTGFGKFMVDLAGFLTVQIVLSLATYFELSKVQKETLRDAEYPGQLMVDCLRERGIITQTDISPLIKALEYLKLDGVKLEILSSFQSFLPTSYQSQGVPMRLRGHVPFRKTSLQQAKHFCKLGEDPCSNFNVTFINDYIGEGTFTAVTFSKGDFLLEYRGELISYKEAE